MNTHPNATNGPCANAKLNLQAYLLRHLERADYDALFQSLRIEPIISETDQFNHCAARLHSHDKRNAPNMLAKIMTQNLSDNVLHAIEEFLSLLSPDKISNCVNKSNAKGESAYFFCRDVALMKIIIKHVSDVNVRRADGDTVLMVICHRSDIKKVDIEMIELLLDNGVDINATDAWGRNALMRYCSSRRCSDNFETIVELLINRGADFLQVSKFGFKAFDSVNNTAGVPLSEKLSHLLQYGCNELDTMLTKSAAKI